MYFFKFKSKALAKFKYFKVKAKKQISKNIKVLQSNQGGEYLSTKFNNLCNALGA